jgi:hypothetical protein
VVRIIIGAAIIVVDIVHSIGWWASCTALRTSAGIDRESGQGGPVLRPVSGADLGASSVKVVPPTKWSRFSMVHYQRTIFTSRCGDAWRLVRSATT